jgi:hypothetical protein
MGGVTVDMEFPETTALSKAVLTLDNHLPASDFTVIYKEKRTTLRFTPGEAVVFIP